MVGKGPTGNDVAQNHVREDSLFKCWGALFTKLVPEKSLTRLNRNKKV